MMSRRWLFLNLLKVFLVLREVYSAHPLAYVYCVCDEKAPWYHVGQLQPRDCPADFFQCMLSSELLPAVLSLSRICVRSVSGGFYCT